LCAFSAWFELVFHPLHDGIEQSSLCSGIRNGENVHYKLLPIPDELGFRDRPAWTVQAARNDIVDALESAVVAVGGNKNHRDAKYFPKPSSGFYACAGPA